MTKNYEEFKKKKKNANFNRGKANFNVFEYSLKKKIFFFNFTNENFVQAPMLV